MRADRAGGPGAFPVLAGRPVEHPENVAFAVEACNGWRYVAGELAAAGITAHLAETADTATQRGSKRRAKTDRADARLMRELLAGGRPGVLDPAAAGPGVPGAAGGLP